MVPEPARGGRQPPARREGGAAGLRRRTPGRLCDQPRPLGGHRRRRAGQLRAGGDRVLSGRTPHRADPALRGRWTAARRDRPRARQPARTRRARGRHVRPVRRQRRRGPPAAGALRPPRRGHDRRLFRAAARRVGGADAGGHPRAAGRRLGGRGLGRRRRRRRRADPNPREDRNRRRRGALRLHGHGAADARAREHDLLHRVLGGLLRHEGADRAGRPAQRRLLPAAARPRAARHGPERGPGSPRRRRQPRDVAARGRRDHQGAGPCPSGSRDRRRADDVRRPDLRASPTAGGRSSTRSTAVARARPPRRTAPRRCASTCRT